MNLATIISSYIYALHLRDCKCRGLTKFNFDNNRINIDDIIKYDV